MGWKLWKSWWQRVAAILLLLGPAPRAQGSVVLSPDISIRIGGVLIRPGSCAVDQSGSIVAQLPCGDGGVHDVTAFSAGNGFLLYSFDTSVDFGGGLIATPADVIRLQAHTPSIAFDGAQQGIPNGVAVDAVAIAPSGYLLLSFDTAVDLGGGLRAQDEDLVVWDGGSFSSYFTGAANGVPPELDLDGADIRQSDGSLLLSFDGSGVIAGIHFDDEDILGFANGNWSLVYDGSSAHPELAAADVDAVPEPEHWMLLMAGIGGLFLLDRRGPLQAADERAPQQ